MNLGTLLARGLWHHRARHFGVLAGAAVASAVLVGALAVGDSVRASLRAQALERIGGVDVALFSGERRFRAALADELAAAVPAVRVAPLLLLSGTAALPSGERRANGVQVFGVDGRFFELGQGDATPYGDPRPAERRVLLSEGLAERLALGNGEALIVRVDAPSAVPRDMLLSPAEDASLALRVEHAGVLPDEHLGRFALTAGAAAPASVFVDLAWLQGQVGAAGHANLILAGRQGDSVEAMTPATVCAELSSALRGAWALEDGELELRVAGPNESELELRTPRVFLDPVVAEAPALAGATRILTYFVNELRAGLRATPYSMVSAIDARVGSALAGILPPDLADGELVINEWLAHDLEAQPGTELTLRYYALGPSRRLLEAETTLRVRGIVPLAGAAADPGLMPDFPGLHDAENCRDWETGVPLDLEAVRDEDEAYWDEHRGTSKAFLSLAAGERLWANRFGTLTAVRLPAAEAGGIEALRARLEAELDPASFGLAFRDLRTGALAASAPATDFGGLFLGLSLFLLAAALLLTALLFAFAVESRAAEIGALASVGFPARAIRRLFLLEGGGVALVGALLGAGLGLAYTRAVLAGLATVWRGAVGGTALAFHATFTSLAGGALAACATALAAMALAVRSALKRPAAELVRASPGLATAASGRRTRWRSGSARAPLAGALLAFAGALGLALWAPSGMGGMGGSGGAAGAFFGAGALVLLAGVAGLRAALALSAARTPRALASLGALGARSSARRPGRSLATAALLACGSFLVLSIGVHRRGAPADPAERRSGTGGFALFARASLPVLFDLNDAEGRAAFALEDADLEGVAVVALRARAGDDASCRQLGVPAEPELLAVDPSELEARGAFRFAGAFGDAEPSWKLLETTADGVIPAIADHASATWTMKKKLGDTFEYVDERGAPFQVRLVGLLEGSILQGSLIIARDAFEQRFPSASGSRVFLIDAPAERAEAVAARLSAALSDVGLEVTPASVRLAEFQEVQNTYLAVFEWLGGLGLLLGSAGLGLVVLRNALERRSELAALRALGFNARHLERLLQGEHLGLFAAGLGVGAIAAAVAWIPTLSEGAGSLPLDALALLAALALSGFVWVSLAARAAARQPLIDALRGE